MTDDGGVLGNLPRSRPGRRSEKRSDEPAPPRRSDPPAASGGGEDRPAADPIADAIRTATGAAAAGARVANGLAREVLRRLPRP
jgi:hypothetical protein